MSALVHASYSSKRLIFGVWLYCILVTSVFTPIHKSVLSRFKSLLQFLLKHNRLAWFGILLRIVPAGAAYIALVVLITESAEAVVRDGKSDYWNLALFLCGLAVYFLCNITALKRSADLIEQKISKLRIDLCDCLRKVEYRVIESRGTSELLSSVTLDLQTLDRVSQLLIDLFLHCTILLFAFLYLMWESPSVMGIVGILFLWSSFVMSAYLKIADADAKSEQADSQKKHFFDRLQELFHGAKELNLDPQKQSTFVNREVFRNLENWRKLEIQNIYISANWMALSHLPYYLVFALLLFILPEYLSSAELITSLAIIYVLYQSFGIIEWKTRALLPASQAVQRLEALEANLKESIDTNLTKQVSSLTWSKLRLDSVSFQYTDTDGKPCFALGPLDLDVHQGEILFVAGGNGSGKSTLLKLLTGLYAPFSGRILLNGRPIPKEQYRGLFSTVFTDFHLFDRLYGLGTISEERANILLETLRLSHKTRIHEKAFTYKNLSTGQRKRLALVAASLEDRSIFVFDEWAADQDPEFRQFFYQTLLPELQTLGKTVICVTHDDRYFQVPNRLVQMEYGKVISIETVKAMV